MRQTVDGSVDLSPAPGIQTRLGGTEADLDAWLNHYNTERPHLGYRNQGRRPIETIMSFVSQEG